MTNLDPEATSPTLRLGFMEENALPEGGFGAVAAPAGVGKTALLVQYALHEMLKGHSVLHVSLQDPVQKIGLWYRELFQNLAIREHINPVNVFLEKILPCRFIMTFQVEGFSVPRLEERISDLTEQDIFHPRVMIIDGLRFQAGIKPTLMELKSFAEKSGLRVWFTVHTHRHEEAESHGIPSALDEVADLFFMILKLEPIGREVSIRIEKGGLGEANPLPLIMDPTTMLILDAK